MQIANQNLQTANQNKFWLAGTANQFFWSKLSPARLDGKLWKSMDQSFAFIFCII